MHLPIAPEARPPEPQKHAVHSSDSLKNYRTRRSDKLQAKLLLATSFLSEQVCDKDVCCAHVFVFSEKNTCAVVQFAAMQVLDGSCTEVARVPAYCWRLWSLQAAVREQLLKNKQIACDRRYL